MVAYRAQELIRVKGTVTPVQQRDSRPRRPLLSRLSSPKRSQIVVYKDPNTIIDIYAGSTPPARRYAQTGTRPARVGLPKPAIGPPKAVIHRRYGSHEPSELFKSIGIVPPLKIQRANSLGSEDRERPILDKKIRDDELARVTQPVETINDKAGLLPALPIAGSPGTPTFFVGAKEGFEPSDDSSCESDAESASPSSEYRPTLYRTRVTRKESEEPEDAQNAPARFPSNSYHTPENRYPHPYMDRRGRLPLTRVDSSPTPMRRTYARRDPTPTFS